jgi:Tfp pilus assembly protein PilZ
VYRRPHSGFVRVPFVQTCTITVRGRAERGMVCNLSMLGVYVHLEHRPEEGEEVDVAFDLPDGNGRFEAAAVVTWVNDVPAEDASALPVGCGLRFSSVAPVDLRRVATIVAAFQHEPRPLWGVTQPSSGRVRIPFVTSCAISSSAGLAPGSVCNLSMLGVYVAVDPPPEPGDSVVIAFRLPGLDGLFERSAVVAWQNLDRADRMHALPTGCGLRFVNLFAEDQIALARLIEEYLTALPRQTG